MSITSKYHRYSVASQLGVLLVILFSSLSFIFSSHTLAGDPCEELPESEQEKCYEKEIEEEQEKYESVSKKLSAIRDQKDSVLDKINGLLSQLSVTQAEINGLQTEINEMKAMLEEINQNLVNRKNRLDKKMQLRNRVLRAHYQSGNLSTLELLMTTLPSSSVADLTGFQFINIASMFDSLLTHEALKLIALLTTEIDSFESDKEEAETLKGELEDAQANLLATKLALDNQKASAQSDFDEIADEEGAVAGELATIQEKLDNLTSKQQEILSAKSGSGVISGYEAPEYKLPDPPSNFDKAYAVMSYGAYTHRRGMSQYGAKGRADDGQDFEEILDFYYPSFKLEDDYDEPDKIRVKGDGWDCSGNYKYYDEEVDFDKYLRRIYEIPESWPKEVLKAQAVAARSYAIYKHKTSGYIRPSQSDQVYKNCDKGDKWQDAVESTEGYVLLNEGSPAVAYYSSTSGGYSYDSGWDAKGGKNNWPGDAYEKRAKSPWFYRAWNTYWDPPNSSNTCGRSTPWLSDDEMVDILNAWIVWNHGDEHVTPITESCWGGDPYSHKEMASKADSYDEKFTSIGKVTSRTIDSGKTTRICFDTNRGNTCIDGQEFAIVFNLRAPHYVAIRRDTQKGALFDIEYED